MFFEAIVKRVPPPKARRSGILQAACFFRFLGSIPIAAWWCSRAFFEGRFAQGGRKNSGSGRTVMYFRWRPLRRSLRRNRWKSTNWWRGEVGFHRRQYQEMVADTKIGDTNQPTTNRPAIPGVARLLKKSKAHGFSRALYTVDAHEHTQTARGRLGKIKKLNDSSFFLRAGKFGGAWVSASACGFLGLLHMEINPGAAWTARIRVPPSTSSTTAPGRALT